jgi:phosphoribosylaminoimidazolecarboxamide formyltransferase/IMP cyclohydrolase
MKLDTSTLLDGLQFKQSLRYGENPHQKAMWCVFPDEGISNANQLQGKELSYNNLIDLEAAISTVKEFTTDPAVVVIKHTNPCGVAIGNDIYSALLRALDGDRISAFGGIVALNDTVTLECAKELSGAFYECIVAPAFDDEAKEILSTKKNLRLLELDFNNMKVNPYNIRSILGGILIQEKDNEPVDPMTWKTVTERQPTMQEIIDLTFAWKVVRHVRSNAIVVARDGRTLGIGAGQMNRVGSSKIALEAKDDVSGGALASDGFFPFDDTVRKAATYGIKAIIQPGGSIKDKESVIACNELGITMVLTGTRHFLH